MRSSGAEPGGRTREGGEGFEYVTASEVASYAYCAKAWHLERVLHSQPSPEAMERRTAGVSLHTEHGAHLAAFGRLAPHLVRWTAVLLVLALLLLAAALLIRLR